MLFRALNTRHLLGEAHCKKHWVKCEKCGKEICISCVGSTSGMILKKYTCKACVAQSPK